MTSPLANPSRPEEFALLVDAVQDYAIFLLSLEGEIRSWNRGAARIMGYSEAEAVGRHFSLFYGPEDLEAEKPRRELETALRDGRVEDDGWRVRKDGTRFWAETVITLLRDDTGTFRGFAKVTRDVTARRKAEEQLRQSGEIFQLLVSSVRDYAIFMLDPEGHIATWNAGAQRLKQYRPEEIIGHHFSEFYPEDAKDKPARELEIARAAGSVEDEGWRIRKDGSRFWANVVITAVYDAQGQLRGFAKVTRDLTERRAAEERLRQNNETFQLLVSSVRDYAIFMLDPEGHIATWNAGAERIKQYKPDEIIGRHFSVFYPEDAKDKPPRELEIARAEGSVEDEGWRVRKDGTRFWANVVITAVYDERRQLRGFAKVTRDITDRMLAEETQRALLEQREARLMAEQEQRRAEESYRVAQEANRAKDEFLMTLSHELRTPMTAILGWARLLPSMSPSEPLFHEAVQSIASGAKLQARLIDDILDVSRIVSGKLRLSPETVEVARLIMNAVDAVNPTADAKDITITTSFAPALGMIVADSTRIQQVLWNLLTNAVKFTPKDGAVQVSARRSASQVQISVTDNGEGIDPRFLPHIFEPFRQAESPQTRVHGGLGLGLSIVRYIVEAHGGTIAAESAGRGQGSTFTVTLPVRAIATAEAPVRNPLGETFLHRDRLRGLSLLVVDDDPESRKLVTAVLRAAGANVLPVDSASAALEALQQNLPDAVITDIAMPDVDGYTFARIVRERYGHAIKVIALSAFPARPNEASGFDAYLTKPVDPFHLVDDVARVALPAPA
ncbi:MAG TPA: PAS domain S-box protein [Thermoanaerobaculia bacterium]|jgi:PAS domain S-box-containing protein